MQRGMTLSETVIAIGVIAFAIPLILAATGSAHQSRRAAEADTRSAWLARDIQRKITGDWSVRTTDGSLQDKFPFPETRAVEKEWSFNQQGGVTEAGSVTEVYRVYIKAEPFVPEMEAPTASGLVRVSISIRYPAKAVPEKRRHVDYQFLSARGMTL